MKRTHSYEINHAKKMVTVTRKFLENATQYNSKEFKLMMQFERLGYFCVDKDSTPEHLVFNRACTLKDSWSKESKK